MWKPIVGGARQPENDSKFARWISFGGIWFVVWILKAGVSCLMLDLIPHMVRRVDIESLSHASCSISYRIPSVSVALSDCVPHSRQWEGMFDLAPPTMLHATVTVKTSSNRVGTGRATPTVRVPNRTRRAHQRHGPFAFAPSRWRRGGTHFGGGDLGVRRCTAMKFVGRSKVRNTKHRTTPPRVPERALKAGLYFKSNENDNKRRHE